MLSAEWLENELKGHYKAAFFARVEYAFKKAISSEEKWKKLWQQQKKAYWLKKGYKDGYAAAMKELQLTQYN